MKKILGLILVFTTLISVSSSCSSNDGKSNSNSKIVGTWGTQLNNGTAITIQPKLTFLSNGKIKYYTYTSGNQPKLEEIGTWNMSEEMLTMDFPKTFKIKYKNKVELISDIEIEFITFIQTGYGSFSQERYYKTIDPNLN